jgi:hypothetical protein
MKSARALGLAFLGVTLLGLGAGNTTAGPASERTAVVAADDGAVVILDDDSGWGFAG